MLGRHQFLRARGPKPHHRALYLRVSLWGLVAASACIVEPDDLPVLGTDEDGSHAESDAAGLELSLTTEGTTTATSTTTSSTQVSATANDNSENTASETPGETGSTGDDTGTWHRIEGLPGGGVSDVSVGVDGGIWMISRTLAQAPHTDFSIYRKTGADEPWTQVLGGAARIDADAADTSIAVTNTWHASLWRGNDWQGIAGPAMDVAMGIDGSWWAVGRLETTGGWSVHALTRDGSTMAWSSTPLPERGGQRIAVDHLGFPWVSDSFGKLWFWDGTRWRDQQVEGFVRALAIGGDAEHETVWVLVTRNGAGGRIGRLYGWSRPHAAIDRPQWQQIQADQAQGLELDVDIEGQPWLVHIDGSLWQLRG